MYMYYLEFIHSKNKNVKWLFYIVMIHSLTISSLYYNFSWNYTKFSMLLIGLFFFTWNIYFHFQPAQTNRNIAVWWKWWSFVNLTIFVVTVVYLVRSPDAPLMKVYRNFLTFWRNMTLFDALTLCMIKLPHLCCCQKLLVDHYFILFCSYKCWR